MHFILYPVVDGIKIIFITELTVNFICPEKARPAIDADVKILDDHNPLTKLHITAARYCFT